MDILIPQEIIMLVIMLVTPHRLTFSPATMACPVCHHLCIQDAAQYNNPLLFIANPNPKPNCSCHYIQHRFIDIITKTFVPKTVTASPSHEVINDTWQ